VKFRPPKTHLTPPPKKKHTMSVGGLPVSWVVVVIWFLPFCKGYGQKQESSKKIMIGSGHINKLLNVSITALNRPTVMFPHHSVKGLGLDSQDLSAVSLVNKQAHSQGLHSTLWKKASPEISQDFLEESLYFLGTVQQPFLSFYSATMLVGQLAQIRPAGPVNTWFHLGNQFYKE